MKQLLTDEQLYKIVEAEEGKYSIADEVRDIYEKKLQEKDERIRELEDALKMVVYDHRTHGRILDDTFGQVKQALLREQNAANI